MLCPTWRKNSGRNSTSHNATNGSGLLRHHQQIPTTQAVKEENRSPSSIEEIVAGHNINIGSKSRNPPPDRSLLFGNECRGSCEVTLRRKTGDTLGLGIAGGSDKRCPPTISCLRPGGIAHRSGCLQVGDVVCAVNGLAIFSLKHDDILTVLRNAGEQVILSIEYDLNHPCFDRPPAGTTIIKNCLVRLDKEQGGLGLTIRGGAYGPDESKSRPLTVTEVRAGGPAHRDGRIRIGDRLSSINGVDVTTATLRTALTLIDRSSECELTIDYDVSILEAINNARGPLLLEIDKPAGEELGVTLNVEETAYPGSDDKGAPLRRNYVIGAISAASIGDRCGALFVGDQLLSVDGVTLEYTTLAETYQLLKGSSTSQNIRVEVVPRYLRAYYAQQECRRETNTTANSPSLRSPQDEPPEYAVIVSKSHQPGSSKKHLQKSESNPISCTAGRGPTSGRRESSSDAVRLASNGFARTSQRQHQQENHAHDCPTSSSNGKQQIVNKKSTETDHRRHNSVNNGRGRGRKLNKQQAQQSFGATQLVSTCSEKCKKGDHRHASGSSKTSHTYRGRSASAVGIRHCTTVQDLLPLAGGSLTASVSAVPCGQVCHSEVMEIVLNCWARGGYGLILHRNQSIPAQQPAHRPLFVSYLERGSPADRSGVVQVGDRILAINDWNAENGTAEEANYLIRNASGPLTLTVEFDVLETVLPSSGVFTVKLAKRGQNLGIVLQPSTSNHKDDAIIVGDVRTGSVAHRCGSVHPGDEILAIDNMPLDNCTVDEASRLLQRASDIVKLRIKKNIGAVIDEYDAGSSHGSHTVIYTVELSRKNAPLGLTIAGTDDRCDPIFISQLAPGGLAERTGAVRVGDRIIAINGQSLHGKRVSEALYILQRAGDSVSLKVARTVAPSTNIGQGPLDNQSYSGALFRSNASGSERTGYLPQLVNIGGGILDRQVVEFHDRESSDKLGTPVQSIDSAVESLEDSPLNDSQHPSTGSNRTSHNSKSSSLSSAAQSDNGAVYTEELSIQLHRTLGDMKNTACTTSQVSRQSDTANSSVSNTVTDDEPYAPLDNCACQRRKNDQEEWIRVLEALETVGETEMLKKLEESILAGSVPQYNPTTSSDDSSCSEPPPKPPFKVTSVPPFPVTNTILRHPYSNRVGTSAGLNVIGTSEQRVHPASASSSIYATAAASAAATASASASTTASAAASATSSATASASASTFAAAIADKVKGKTPVAAELSSRTYSSNCPSSRPLSISTVFTGYEHDHIPFITTPDRRSPSTVASRIQESATDVTRNLNGSRVNSPTPSSIQLSGSATPSADVNPTETDTAHTMSRPSTSGYSANGGRQPRVPLEFYHLSLTKDKVYNDFGFSVSDGVQEKGVYINKVRIGGPADSSGNVKPYDRILQVNGTSLQGLDCMLAVPVLAAAGDCIDLFICRDPLLASSFRGTDSIVEEDEEEGSLIGQTTV